MEKRSHPLFFLHGSQAKLSEKNRKGWFKFDPDVELSATLAPFVAHAVPPLHSTPPFLCFASSSILIFNIT
jgi:hypothetical protein